ncbi:hypothetical protein ABZ318_01490 [Streptomyces sp. NPDC006197]|uniref:hypothetical protein n=1 Tax=Streptomyces sp. NPDC006197 TaxID=3156685 RepID=UPI0033AD9C33
MPEAVHPDTLLRREVREELLHPAPLHAFGETAARTVRGLDVSRALGWSWQEGAAPQSVHSADGRLVAVVRAGRISLLDGRTGWCLATVPVAPPGGTSVDSPVLMSLSADGRRLAFGRGSVDVLGEPTRITVWDTTRNRSLVDIAVPSEDMAFTGLALSPDGTTLMTPDDSGGAITVRDAADGTKLRVLNRGKNDGVGGDDGALATVSSVGGTVLTAPGESRGVGLLGPDGGRGRDDAFDLAERMFVSGGAGWPRWDPPRSPPMRCGRRPLRAEWGRTCSYRGGPLWSRVLETGRTDARIVVTSE